MPKIRDSKAQEKKLASYWRWRAKEDKSDFDEMLDYAERFDVVIDQEDQRAIAGLIVKGYPLSRAEYYAALAIGFLLVDLPYEEFYKKHWHETSTHRAYVAKETCERCCREKRERNAKSRRRAVHS